MTHTLTRATGTMDTTIMMTTTTRNGRSHPRARKKGTASTISTIITTMAMEATGMEGMAMAVMVESSGVMEATVTDMGSAAATASKATTWAAMAGIASMAA